jgi:EmrB/QacA subfamily drug resistance transporter
VTAAPTQQRAPSVAVVFGGLLLVMFIAALDATIVSTALPTIAGELGGLDHLPWVVTAYMLAQTVVMPLYGKLGDLFGRKVVLQAAVMVFLAGSALCGIAQTMTQLIAFRAVQGLGGGGLLVVAQAAIGDVVAPSERGRYAGFFGGVFALATVAGPLLGGLFTSALSWRWIFYVNVPIGLLAIVVLAMTLPPGARVRRRIDVAGTALLAVALTALVLLTTLGGTTVAWGSPAIVVLAIVTVAALAAFVAAERRAVEPVLPLDILRDRVVAVTAVVSLVVGFALFGSTTFLPLFLQVVDGASPTASGLLMVPLMGGSLVLSIITGQLVTRRRRYRVFPIAGTAVLAVGLFLLSTMDERTGRPAQAVFMFIVGAGLGLTMQVLVLAAQNAVPYEQLGVATSSVTLFRSVGGSLGTAVLGAVFTARLRDALPPGPGTATIDPQLVRGLPPQARATFLHAFTSALDTVFLVGAGVAVVAFAASWLIRERPLRETVTTSDLRHAYGAPDDPTSLEEITRGLGVLAGRDRVLRFIEATAEEAGLPLDPRDVWLLVRLGEDPARDLDALAARQHVDPGALEQARARLQERGYVASPDGRWSLTPQGEDALERFTSARRRRLEELLSGWEPEHEPELQRLVRRLCRELGTPQRTPVGA